MNERSTAKSPAVMFAIGCGAITLLGLLAAGAMFAVYHFTQAPTASDADDPAADPETEPAIEGSENDAGAIGTAPSHTDPALEMRSRYRLGPNINVDAMLPNPARAANGAVVADLQGGPSENPFRVFGAEYRAAPQPIGDASALTRVDHDGASTLALLVGVPERMSLHGARNVDAYTVSFEGYPGHFRVPATTPTEFGPVAALAQSEGALAVAMSSARDVDGRMRGRGESFEVVMHVSAEYEDHSVSSPLDINVHIESVGLGDVEIAMVMDETTDLDLYVEDPTGATLSYRNRRNSAGGELDMDANAGCGSNMGVNAEHVFYPAQSAPSGRYSVMISHYEDCTNGRAIPYRLTVRACGETAVFSGRFAPRTHNTAGCPSNMDDDACQTVVAFTLPTCETPRS